MAAPTGFGFEDIPSRIPQKQSVKDTGTSTGWLRRYSMSVQRPLEWQDVRLRSCCMLLKGSRGRLLEVRCRCGSSDSARQLRDGVEDMLSIRVLLALALAPLRRFDVMLLPVCMQAAAEKAVSASCIHACRGVRRCAHAEISSHFSYLTMISSKEHDLNLLCMATTTPGNSRCRETLQNPRSDSPFKSASFSTWHLMLACMPPPHT